MPDGDALEEQVERRMTELGPLIERRRLAETEGVNPDFAASLRARLVNEHPHPEARGRLRAVALAFTPLAALLALILVFHMRSSGAGPAIRLGAPSSGTAAPPGDARNSSMQGFKQAPARRIDGPFYSQAIPSSPAIPPIPGGNNATETRAHGIWLSLRIPRGTYPRNALVKVRVIAANISRHDVLTIPTPQYGFCPTLDPVIRVQSRDGRQNYSPAIFGVEFISCPMRTNPRGTVLRPGQRQTLTQYIVLRGPRLQESFAVLDHGRSVTVTTPRLLVRRAGASAPHITMHGGTHPFAVVSPPSHTHGPMLAAMRWQCRTSSGNPSEESGATPLTPADPRHLAPALPRTCAALLQWHAVVGWEGHPVAGIHYRLSRGA